MKALCFNQFGGPDVLRFRELPTPEPRAGEALVRMRSIGLNFADIYRRRGNYHLAGKPPYVLGYEGAGEIAALGPHGAAPTLPALKVGDRVGFADAPFANAELVAVSLDRLIPLPDDISFTQAASSLLQGLTAQFLTEDSHPLRPGEVVLIHAAAGGVGCLLVQVAKLRGAQVIGLVSTAEKAARVRQLGADLATTSSEGWVGRVRAFAPTQRGVDVVYDSVGSTLLQSFEATRVGGHVVFYGMAGGDPPAIDPRMLMDTSRTLTGGDLWNVLSSHAERVRRAGALFDWLRTGKVQVEVSRTFPLSEGEAAHRYLESRKSTGKVLLAP